MSELVPLEPKNIGRFGLAPIGAMPDFAWLPIDSLRIDPSFQRPVSERGRRTIEAIARDFSWGKFTPLVVSPAGNAGREFYSIIDGQHRATAAAERGFLKAPCWIVKASVEAQASAFAAINGQVTAMSPLSLYKAALKAGEPWATGLRDCAEAEGARVLTHPLSFKRMEPGDTQAITTLKRGLELQGPEAVRLAIACITQTRHNTPGALSAGIVGGLLNSFRKNPHWLKDRKGVIAAAERCEFRNLMGFSFVREKRELVESRLEAEASGVGAGRKVTLAPTRPAGIGSSFESEVLRLHGRRVGLTAIATILQRPYAEVEAVIDRAKKAGATA